MIEAMKDIGFIAGAILGVYVIWQKAVMPIFNLLKRVEEVHNIITDLPEWKDAVDLKLDQLSPNSGNSLYDRVTGTGETLVLVQGELEELKELVQAHIDNPTAHS